MPKDVFLCHNSKEKAEVEKIRAQLLQKGIDAWLDKHDFEPFLPWQDQLEEIIPQIKAAAVFIGSSGVGPWADIEMKEFLVEFAQRKLRMGLVILPDCPDELIDQVPRFMKRFHWVDFRQPDPDPMEQLIWGITGIKPAQEPKPIEHSSLTAPSQPNQNALDLLNSHLGVQPNTSAVEAIEILNSHPGIQPPTATDDLASEKGIDYTKLRDLLAAKNWKEADEETYRVMIQAVRKENGEYFDDCILLNFPCTDLRTINGLWVKYSNGHFGFSVQKDIYLSVGGKADGKYYKEAWHKFGDRVGWRVKRNFFVSNWISFDDVNYVTAFPIFGHLPYQIITVFWQSWRQLEGCEDCDNDFVFMTVGREMWACEREFSSLASRLVNCNI
jgi:hypothetical protein